MPSDGRRTRGEGSIYQRESDGRWIGVIDLGWVGGKRVRRTVSAKTLKELRPKFRALQAEIESGVISDQATVEQWLESWLRDIAGKKLRPSTLRTYDGYIRTWIKPHLGKKRLDKLRAEHIEALYDAMEEAGRTDATRRQVHAILHSSLKAAVQRRRIVANPADHVVPPSVGKGSHGFLTVEEARKVLACLDHEDVSASRWACALLAGLRQGEALGLTWEHVDLERGVIHVRQAAQRIKGQGIQVVGLKSSTAARDVPMVPPVLEALRAEPSREGYVWGGDKPTDPRRDWAAWKDLLALAGVPPRPLHAARATTGSLLMAAGVSDILIKEILGHSQVITTQRHYLHGDSRLHREAMDAMTRLLELED